MILKQWRARSAANDSCTWRKPPFGSRAERRPRAQDQVKNNIWAQNWEPTRFTHAVQVRGRWGRPLGPRDKLGGVVYGGVNYLRYKSRI